MDKYTNKTTMNSDHLMRNVEWKPIENGPLPEQPEIPWATHEGILKLGSVEIPVVQLNDGTRLVTEEGMNAFFAFLNGETK